MAPRKLGITYPVALDNGYSTWTNYRNRYWPARIPDRRRTAWCGTSSSVRATTTCTEKLIRELLTDANRSSNYRRHRIAPDMTPSSGLTPETYLSASAR